jgi:hypothetical protein
MKATTKKTLYPDTATPGWFTEESRRAIAGVLIREIRLVWEALDTDGVDAVNATALSRYQDQLSRAITHNDPASRSVGEILNRASIT